MRLAYVLKFPLWLMAWVLVRGQSLVAGVWCVAVGGLAVAGWLCARRVLALAQTRPLRVLFTSAANL